MPTVKGLATVVCNMPSARDDQRNTPCCRLLARMAFRFTGLSTAGKDAITESLAFMFLDIKETRQSGFMLAHRQLLLDLYCAFNLRKAIQLMTMERLAEKEAKMLIYTIPWDALADMTTWKRNISNRMFAVSARI